MPDDLAIICRSVEDASEALELLGRMMSEQKLFLDEPLSTNEARRICGAGAMLSGHDVAQRLSFTQVLTEC